MNALLAAAAALLAGLTGPQLLVIALLVTGVFAAGVAFGRAIWKPRPDFHRFELPPQHRIR